MTVSTEDYKNIEQVEDFNASHIFAEDDAALNIAKTFFHVQYLFPWQRLVISNITDSFNSQNSACVENLKEQTQKDPDISDAFCLGHQIVLLPTGAGKSMCFLVPSLMLPGATLIIYPLLALMADQMRRMTEASIDSVVFKGGQTEQEQDDNFCRIKNGTKIILANPEILQSERILKKLKECNISHIAIDEAHCVSEWGDSFRPAYLTLGKIIKELNVNTVTAFTATASPGVLSRVSEILFDGNAHIVRSESDRPNIHYYVKYAYSKQKALFELCRTEKRPVLIFCGTRNKAEETARELSAYYPKDEVRFYHAGMTKEEKTEVEKWYFPHKTAILCSTCAFGMGIDKPDIRTVIHLEPSVTAESYIQEAGRGGRDRNVAKAILLWNFDDSIRFEKFPVSSRERVIKSFAESKTCRRQILLDALGAEQAVCSGCDICLKKPSETIPEVFDAEDRKSVLKFIRHHQKMYSLKQIIPELKNRFNKATCRTFGENVWTENDVKIILSQLKQEESIKICRWPWKEKITLGKPMFEK